MKGIIRSALIALLLVALSSGCQCFNTGTETRMDEQVLDISFENAKAEEVFAAIINGTEPETRATARIGSPSVSLYSRTQTVAFNAHCNDHIRAMDKNADLLISQKEAEDYYRCLSEQGKMRKRKEQKSPERTPEGHLSHQCGCPGPPCSAGQFPSCARRLPCRSLAAIRS